MPGLNAAAVEVQGTPANPVTVSNTGATNIYVDPDSSVSVVRHLGFLRPGDSHTFTDNVWLATDGTAGSYTATSPVSNVELGYAEITANVALTGATQDIAGLAVTVTVSSRPINLIFDAQSGQISAAGNFNTLQLVEGATILAVVQFGVAAANTIFPLHREKRLAPTPGVHTYKMQGGVSGVVGGNDRLVATPTSPAFLQAVQL